MQRKVVVLALLMAALAAGGAFADGLSAGGGLLFDYSGNNGVKNGSNYFGVRVMSFGGYGFFDATYVEADISFAYGSLTAVAEGGGSSATEDMGSAMQLGLSLLGKYPIELGSVLFFPLFGINYNMVLSAKDPNGNAYTDAGDLSQFGLLTGVGADFGLSDSLYLRAEGLFSIRFASKYQKDAAVGGASTTLGMGPRIKVGIGIKF